MPTVVVNRCKCFLPQFENHNLGWKQGEIDIEGWKQIENDNLGWKQGENNYASWKQFENDNHGWKQIENDNQGWKLGETDNLVWILGGNEPFILLSNSYIYNMLASKPRFLSTGLASQSLIKCVFGTFLVSWHYIQDNYTVSITCSWIELF